MKIDETKLNEEIKKLEDLRDEWSFTSAEHIDIDQQIQAIERIIKKCTIKS